MQELLVLVIFLVEKCVIENVVVTGNISGGTLDFSKLGAAGTAAIQGLTWNMI